MIGIVCGSTAIFFLILFNFISIYRRSQVLNKFEESLSSSFYASEKSFDSKLDEKDKNDDNINNDNNIDFDFAFDSNFCVWI